MARLQKPTDDHNPENARHGKRRRVPIRYDGYLKLRRGVFEHIDRMGGARGLGLFIFLASQANHHSHLVELTQRQVSEHTGLARDTLRKYMAHLVAEGYLTTMGGGVLRVDNYSGVDQTRSTAKGGVDQTRSTAKGGVDQTRSGVDQTRSTAPANPLLDMDIQAPKKRIRVREEVRGGASQAAPGDNSERRPMSDRQEDVYKQLRRMPNLAHLKAATVEYMVRVLWGTDLTWALALLVKYQPVAAEKPGRVLTFLERAYRGKLWKQYQEDGVQVTNESTGTAYLIRAGADEAATARHKVHLARILTKRLGRLLELREYSDAMNAHPKHERVLFAKLGMVVAPDPPATLKAEPEPPQGTAARIAKAAGMLNTALQDMAAQGKLPN